MRCRHGNDMCGVVQTECCDQPRPSCGTVNVAEAGDYCRDGHGCQNGE